MTAQTDFTTDPRTEILAQAHALDDRADNLKRTARVLKDVTHQASIWLSPLQPFEEASIANYIRQPENYFTTPPEPQSPWPQLLAEAIENRDSESAHAALQAMAIYCQNAPHQHRAQAAKTFFSALQYLIALQRENPVTAATAQLIQAAIRVRYANYIPALTIGPTLGKAAEHAILRATSPSIPDTAPVNIIDQEGRFTTTIAGLANLHAASDVTDHAVANPLSHISRHHYLAARLSNHRERKLAALEKRYAANCDEHSVPYRYPNSLSQNQSLETEDFDRLVRFARQWTATNPIAEEHFSPGPQPGFPFSIQAAPIRDLIAQLPPAPPDPTTMNHVPIQALFKVLPHTYLPTYTSTPTIDLDDLEKFRVILTTAAFAALCAAENLDNRHLRKPIAVAAAGYAHYVNRLHVRHLRSYDDDRASSHLSQARDVAHEIANALPEWCFPYVPKAVILAHDHSAADPIENPFV